MVKNIKTKAKTASAKAKVKSIYRDEDGIKEHEPPSRLQRKLLKRVTFLEKLSTSKPNKAKTSGVQKKKKRRPSAALDNYEFLAQSLEQAARAQSKANNQSGTAVGTLKARERITRDESARLQQVVKHPEFLKDPLAAITSHLSASLPSPPAAPKAKQDPKQRKQEKKRKAKLSKVGSGAIEAQMIE